MVYFCFLILGEAYLYNLLIPGGAKVVQEWSKSSFGLGGRLAMHTLCLVISGRSTSVSSNSLDGPMLRYDDEVW